MHKLLANFITRKCDGGGYGFQIVKTDVKPPGDSYGDKVIYKYVNDIGENLKLSVNPGQPSAKIELDDLLLENYRKDLPNLPPELWRKIFDCLKQGEKCVLGFESVCFL